LQFGNRLVLKIQQFVNYLHGVVYHLWCVRPAIVPIIHDYFYCCLNAIISSMLPALEASSRLDKLFRRPFYFCLSFYTCIGEVTYFCTYAKRRGTVFPVIISYRTTFLFSCTCVGQSDVCIISCLLGLNPYLTEESDSLYCYNHSYK